MDKEVYKYDRHSARLKCYDYSTPGMYFVTICIHNKNNLFGSVLNDCMILNTNGKIAQESWESLPGRFAGLRLDSYVIMPNHFHGIVVMTAPEGKNRCDYTLGQAIGAFKALTSYHIHISGTKSFHWQQRYWDSVIRDEQHLFNIRQYILNNPTRWALDKLYQPLSCD